MTVRKGTIGTSDDQTKRLLQQDLDSYANYEDPDDPSEILQDFDFQYLSGGGKPVSDSCYNNIDQIDLEELENIRMDDALIKEKEVDKNTE